MPDDYGNPTFKDLFEDPEVLRRLYNNPSRQPSPLEQAFNYSAPAQVPLPSPLSQDERIAGRAAITSGGLTDLAGIYLGQAPRGRSEAALQDYAGQFRAVEDKTRAAQMFNAGQENQFGRASQARDAAMQRLLLQEQGKNSRVQTKMRGGKVRVLTETDPSTGQPVNVAYQETTDENGNMILQRMGIKKDESVSTSTPKPVHYSAVATEGGGVTRFPTTGTTPVGQVITGPGGQPIMKQPSQGQIAQIAGDITTLRGIDEIWKGYQDIHKATGGDAPLFSITTGKRILGTELGETKYGGKVSPAYNQYITKRRLGLNRYIKGVTGAQFSIAELKRYEALFPQVTDDEETAKTKLSDIAGQAVADMNAYISAHGGLAGMRNDPTESWRFGAEGVVDVPPKPGQRTATPKPPPPGTKKSLEELADEAMR